jgi:hypothetical protein
MMTVRYRHPETKEVFEGALTRIIPEYRALLVQRDGVDYQNVVSLDNVVFITTPNGHKVFN